MQHNCVSSYLQTVRTTRQMPGLPARLCLYMRKHKNLHACVMLFSGRPRRSSVAAKPNRASPTCISWRLLLQSKPSGMPHQGLYLSLMMHTGRLLHVLKLC